jgi:hypothetical protein
MIRSQHQCLIGSVFYQNFPVRRIIMVIFCHAPKSKSILRLLKPRAEDNPALLTTAGTIPELPLFTEHSFESGTNPPAGAQPEVLSVPPTR